MSYSLKNAAFAGAVGTLLFVATGLTPPPSSIEAGQVQELTAELVLGLLARPYQPAATEDPRLLAGELPPQMDSLLYIPDGGVIHGSVAYATRGTVVATFTDTPAQLWETYQREMEVRGWTTRDSASGAFESLGGVSIPWVYCRDDDTSIFITATDRGATGTRLRIDYTTDNSNSRCDPRSDRIPRRPRIVSFTPPRRTDLAIGACGDTIASGFQQASTFASSLSGDELLAHYTAQFQESGWTKPDTLPAVDLVTRSFVLREQDATESATLLLAPIADRPGCWSLVLYGTWTPPADR